MDLLGSLGDAAQSVGGDAMKTYNHLFNADFSKIMKSYFDNKYPVSNLINKLNKAGLTGYDQVDAAPQMSQSGLGEANQNVQTGLGGGLNESQSTHGLSLGSVLSLI